MENDWDAVVIGGGAAGLSAALMLGRSRRRTLVIDGGRPRNRFSAHLHGALGHDGADPAALLEAGRAEVRRYGVRIAEGVVAALTDEGSRIRVTRADGAVDTARAVVIATGLRDELPDVPGLREEWGRTVLHCPYCHGWEVAGRRLGVLVPSPAGLHSVGLVRQLSDDVVAFTAAAEPLDEDTSARLTARSVRVVAGTVREVRRSDDDLVVITQDGSEHPVDALFTGGGPAIHHELAAPQARASSDAPGRPRGVPPRTPARPRAPRARRGYRAGNAGATSATGPLAMAAGSMAGAGANAALVQEDGDLAVSERTAERNAGWDRRYATEDRFWSGRVNTTVAAVVEGLEPGTALDVGSGEGGDVVWLAERGWRATGVDVSPTAVRRAADLAAERGVRVDLVVGDGAAAVDGAFDLVLAGFLHSWEQDFPRLRLLRDASGRVAPDGRLLVVSHAAPPPWASEAHEHAPVLRGPEEELALLALDPAVWVPELVEVRGRDAVAPDGTPARLDDGVLLLRRMR